MPDRRLRCGAWVVTERDQKECETVAVLCIDCHGPARLCWACLLLRALRPGSLWRLPVQARLSDGTASDRRHCLNVQFSFTSELLFFQVFAPTFSTALQIAALIHRNFRLNFPNEEQSCRTYFTRLRMLVLWGRGRSRKSRSTWRLQQHSGERFAICE